MPNRIKKFRRLQRFTTFLALLPSKSRHTILQTNRDLDIAMQEGELGEPLDMGLSRICSRQEWVPIQDPDSKARMLAVMATVYQNLGLDSRAESLLKQAIPRAVADYQGGESEEVDLELAQRFQSPYAHRLVLVISGIPDPDSAKGADALDFLTSSLHSLPGVSGAVSSLDWPDSLFCRSPPILEDLCFETHSAWIISKPLVPCVFRSQMPRFRTGTEQGRFGL